MEAALVSAFLKTLAPKLFTFLQEKHKQLTNLERDIRYIRNELDMIAAAIQDHDRRMRDGFSEVQRAWIEDVRELACDMEDCIDRFMHRVTRAPSSSLHLGLKTMTTRTKLAFADKIRELKKKSEELSKQRESYAGGGGGGVQSSASGASSSTFSDTHAVEADLVGMDVPRDELLELIGEIEGQPKQLKVISIVGFGGLGKTLLARQVYKSVAAGMQYEPLVWIRAAEKGAGDVLKEILHELGKQKGAGDVLKEILHELGKQVHDGNCDTNKLSTSLGKYLEDKRFFIVIDDMRTEYWNSAIKNAFPVVMGVSSIVIVTTAIQSIANACSSGNGHVYKMRSLDKVDSKRLFLKAASLEDYPPAEAVLKKCDGLPLALVTTAQFLQSKGHLTPTRCAKLCDSLGKHLETEDTFERMKHVLFHNYTSLPSHVVKACLLYLGIFPSGRPVRRKSLIRRWLAEGFVEADHRRSSLDVAVDNFEELINRSIIQPIDVRNNTEVKTCQTHGMMLEFILHKSMCENFITLLYDQPHLPNKIRRFSIHSNSVTRARTNSDINLSLVRSLTIFGKAHKHVLEFSKYELLRVLDLEECDNLEDEHLKKICNLLLLRYLSLGGAVTVLPKEIAKQKFLETLDIRRTKISILPIEVIELPCLIHLFGMFKLEDAGQKMCKLQTFLSEKSNLQTLAGFVADKSIEFPQLMDCMNNLTKVKIWGKSTADASKNFTHLSKAIQGFIQRGTNVNDVRSLSLNFEEWSEDFLNFSLKDSCYLSSLKLKGKICRLPPFVTYLDALSELCISSSDQLSRVVLDALSNVHSLHYLKLIASHLDKFVVEHGALKCLRRLCIVVQFMTHPEIQEGALPRLESLWLICKDLNGLCGIRIERLGNLKEVALHDGASDETKEQWKEAAKKHPKRPKVLFVKPKEADQMQMGNEPTENSESPAEPAPPVADVQRQLNEGCEAEPPVVQPKPAGKLARLIRGSRNTNESSTELPRAVNGNDTISTRL